MKKVVIKFIFHFFSLFARQHVRAKKEFTLTMALVVPTEIRKRN